MGQMGQKHYSGEGVVLRRKTWWLDCLINKTRYQRKLGKGISRSAAVEISLKYRVEILSGNVGFAKQRKDPTFDEVRTKFEARAVKENRPRTVKTYRECLRRLAESFGGKRMGQISTMAVQTHKHDRKKAGAPIRANRECSVLRRLFNYCREEKLYEGPNPVDATVKFFPEPREKTRVLSPQEEDRLLAKCEEPLRTLVLIGIYCGLRLASEALTLRWSNLDLRQQRSLTVIGAYAKNGKMRMVPLNSTVREALERLPHPPNAEWVFTTRKGTPYKSMPNGFEAACKAAGLEGVTPHTLRHTFASRLMENGVDPIKITKLAGWSSIKMLDRYAHADPTRLAEAVEGLSRRDIHSAPEKRVIQLA
jgi:integrase